jgi:hypothetical protein
MIVEAEAAWLSSNNAAKHHAGSDRVSCSTRHQSRSEVRVRTGFRGGPEFFLDAGVRNLDSTM